MTGFEVLAKAAGLAGPELIKLLQTLAAAVPDLAPEVQAWIARLNAAITPEALAALGSDVMAELASIAQGKFDGRQHPSDLA